MLRITPIHGDTIYWDVGGPATTGSAKLSGNQHKTRELRVSFLVVDSKGAHETGEPVTWQNRVTLKNRVYQSGADKMCELRAAPHATIKYTTDGSDPKIAGATYDSAFIVPKGAPMVLAWAERDGIESPVERIVLSWEKDEEVKVDPKLPVTWRRRHAASSTKETYELLARLGKFKGQAVGLSIDIGGESGVEEWLNLTTFDEKRIAPELVQECLDPLRKVQADGQVKLALKALYFDSGQDLLDRVKETKTSLQPSEIKQ